MVGRGTRNAQMKGESENEKSLRNIVRAGERKGVFYWATTVIGPITVVAHRTPVIGPITCSRHATTVVATAYVCALTDLL